jgi:hypothetical protein
VKEDCEVLHFRDINSLFHAVQKRPGFFDDLERRFVSRVNDSEFLLEEKKKEVRKLNRFMESLNTEFEDRKTRFFWIDDLLQFIRAERPARKQTPRTTYRPGKQDPASISHAAFNQWMSDWSTSIREIVEDVKEETAFLKKLKEVAEGLCFALEKLLEKYQYGWIRVMILKLKDLEIQPQEHNLGQYVSKSRETVFGTDSEDVH